MFGNRFKAGAGVLAAALCTALISSGGGVAHGATPDVAERTGPAVAVATPTFEGPIPSRGAPGTDVTRNYPQLASEPFFDLSDVGYTEEEFFFSGDATRYETPPLADGVEVSTGHPYKSRAIVRRPVDPRDFNGIVIVEWVNVTSGYGIDLHWQYSRDYLTREGYAYVGVQAQRVGVHQAPYGLREWSPERYGTLDLTAGGTITDDSLSYDVYSQVGQALQGEAREALLPEFKEPSLVLAVGQSQSANRMTLYYNSIQPLHQVYDGFLLQVGGAPFRTDVDTKLIHVNSENEIVRGQSAKRQPSSENFRAWEVAGASHVTYQWAMYRHALASRDGIATPNYSCTPEALSHVPLRYVLNAGYHHLENWVLRGRPAPEAEPIRVDSLSPLVIPRDENGHVFGGIRQAAIEVPVATNTGANEQTNSPCNLYGSHQPFDQEKLAQLYPTHRDYVSAVRAVTRQNVRDGFILRDDAREIIEDAENSPVGTGRPLPIQ